MFLPQHFLYFLPLPHGHGSFLPAIGLGADGTRDAAAAPRSDIIDLNTSATVGSRPEATGFAAGSPAELSNDSAFVRTSLLYAV